MSNLTNTLGRTLQDAARPGGLLSQTVNSVGQTVARTVSKTGTITESVLDTAGNVVSQRSLGSVQDLTDVVSETTNQAGQTVRRVMDTSGAILEYTLDSAGPGAPIYMGGTFTTVRAGDDLRDQRRPRTDDRRRASGPRPRPPARAGKVGVGEHAP